MKLISYLRAGRPSYGAVTDQGVVDLRESMGPLAPDLRSLIAEGLLPSAAERAAMSSEWLRPEDLTLLPVIPNPGKILCVGLNYHDHLQETGREAKAHPTIFLRIPESQAAHGSPLLLPPESSQFDYEGEIAVVIGRAGRRIRPEHAWDHIAGYSCYNDGSLRDWQAASNQWTAGKNFTRTGAFGPWLVTADEIAPGETMNLVTRLNGQVMQSASTDLLIHGIPELLAHISTFATLDPGDVIVTGTPGGVGFKRQPPVFMQPGDVVEVEVDWIGTLRNTIAREA